MALGQIVSLPNNGYLNGVNLAYPGEVTLQGAQTKFADQLGARWTVRSNAVRFDSSVGTVRGGVFQFVQTKAASTIQPAPGLLAWWDPTTEGFVVTPDIPTGSSLLAGVYLNTPTKGNYTVIQVEGLVDCKTVATLDTTGAVGQLAFAATGSLVDTDATSTAITAAILKIVVGVFQTAPGNAGLHEVFLTGTKAKY